jgi:signal peptidase I
MENIENNANEPKGIKKYLLFAYELAKIALIAFVIVAPIRYFLFQPFIVSGESMVPSFQSGDYLIVEELSYRFSQPERGDVVVFDTDFIPQYKNQRFIKRVIGLPGETVSVSNGKVEIIKDNNVLLLDEKYLPANIKTIGEVRRTLGKDEFFVMGDNRDYSYDSRAWGVVPKKEIIGKAVLRLFPINTLTGIARPAY